MVIFKRYILLDQWGRAAYQNRRADLGGQDCESEQIWEDRKKWRIKDVIMLAYMRIK